MNDKKELLRKPLEREHILFYLRRGIQRLSQGKQSRRMLYLVIIAEIFIAVLVRVPVMELFPAVYVSWVKFSNIAFFALFTIANFAFLVYLGAPRGSLSIHRNLARTGLQNELGEVPFLVERRRELMNPKIETLVLESYGIPISEFTDRQAEIESALDVYIVGIERAYNNRTVQLRTVPAKGAFPERVNWDDALLNERDFELFLGEGLAEVVSVDLSKIPHMLIGGATGSGKTALLRCLLHQCIIKSANIIIADFKGVDFGDYWRERCEVILEPDALLARLNELVEELSRRKVQFRAKNCDNLNVYNCYANEPLPRIIFACDEISELLDKTGASREQKERIAEIESALSTIARQGRAFGIHMILSTQRPDANILAGQIKNNIDFRVCGRADKVLSQIILDKTDAADQILPKTQGRFLTNDNRLFQAYYFDEKEGSP